ncbi:hypothetical protein BGX24_007649 [Mortierella sp. AD032]|nr:hypothetical protein BGX24_007649 [Mortierella sp. AD032]
MKLTFFALSAVAIASYTNVQGLPAIFKRIIDPTKFNGNDVASFTSGYSDATVENGNVVSTKISKSPLTITAAHSDDFGSFVTSVLTQPSFIFTAKGALTANLKSPFKAIPGFGGADGFGGVGGATTLLAVSGVGFESSVTMTGFNSLPGVSFVNIFDFTNDANGFTLTLNIKVTNPSLLLSSFLNSGSLG